MSERSTSYDTATIQALEGREAVRKRPGMYLGSTGERGLRNLVLFVADRSVNDVLAGRARRVDVTLTADGGVSVADDGPGDSVDDLLARLPIGRRCNSRHDVARGYGDMYLFVANALSSRLTAEVRRDGVRRVQEHAHGVAVSARTGADRAAGNGTVVTFWPDAEIFAAAEPSFTALADRFRELALLNRGLEITLTDLRSAHAAREERYHFPGGVRDFVALLDDHSDNGSDSGGEPDDVLAFEHEDPRMAGTMEVALRWRASGEERVRSFANSHPTVGGGTHENGFRRGVAAALGTDRIGPGLTAVVSVKLDDPVFAGATLDVLGTTAASACVEEAVRTRLGAWLRTHPDRAAALVARLRAGGA
ncbi:DNA gyrase subunit B [Kitasatospora sp. NPDC057692]|uniref:DNA gyrase subunit B n=1 Tax=Kitasatospora sp. NPDC057692 TaxID=3346215 RepID=UPI0036A94DDE